MGKKNRNRASKSISTPKSAPLKIAFLLAIPIAVALWVWLSSLAFVPVPWPDDSAFYFVAKELFKWPPRWVMLPQAPFEPTYRIFNFNTMPLYPILIGLGKFIGIDGSFALKLWPLGAWALTGVLLIYVLFKKGLPYWTCVFFVLVFALDPELRWASVLVRPESLIGLFGMALVLGLTFGFPERLKPRMVWDPIAALLALAAYSHFNAFHLVFPVCMSLIRFPRRMLRVGALTLLYLSPWLGAVCYHIDLFQRQMGTQWARLSGGNPWLNSVTSAIAGIFQTLGSPEAWPPEIQWAAHLIFVLFFTLVFYEVGIPSLRFIYRKWVVLGSRNQATPTPESSRDHATLVAAPPAPEGLKFANYWSSFRTSGRNVFARIPGYFENKDFVPSLSPRPALAWTVSAIWLFHSKPEVWFVYYIHVAFWCFVGVVTLKLWKNRPSQSLAYAGLLGSLLAIGSIFGYMDYSQASRLESTSSWHWDIYKDFVDCVDQHLTMLEMSLKKTTPFQVWCPTFPDITIELSRRHPQWDLTRTNDFYQRYPEAIQHGRDVDVVVTTETLNPEERNIYDRAELHPEIRSLWMNWEGYYLNMLWKEQGWKPNRYICQKGRWQAFIFQR